MTEPAMTYSCGHSAPTHDFHLLNGYADETWPTIGGTIIRVIRCFPCRNLTLAITNQSMGDAS